MGTAHTYAVSPTKASAGGASTRRCKTLSKSYKLVMKGCAGLSAAVGLIYLVVASIAIGDGIGVGIEIPREINIISCTLVVLGGTVAGEAWFASRAARESASRDIRPVVHDEVEQTITRLVPEMTSVIAGRVAARNGALIREIIASELAEVVDAAVQRAHRSGMILQAQHTGALGTAKVVRMRINSDD